MTATTKLVSAAIVLFLVDLSASSDAGQAIDERLAAWRADINRLAPACDMMTLNTENYRALLDMGPNVLPHLVEVMRDETNPRALYGYGSLFARCGYFEAYAYSVGAEKVGPYDIRDEDEATRPFLSRRVGMGELPKSQRGEVDKGMYLRWWDQRDTFLNRPHVIERIREITGRTPEAFARYGFAQHRLLAKEILTYGIYNFPYFIDVIAEDDNPIILYHLGLPLPLSKPLDTPHPRKQDEVFNAVQAVYPARDAKVRVICSWWGEKKDTFTELPELYQAIDTRVTKLEEELKAKQKP